MPAFGAVFVLQHGGRYVLQWLHGSGQVGLYTAGVTLGSAVGLMVSGFQCAWTPFFMSYMNRPTEARSSLGRACSDQVFGVGSVSLLFYVLAKPMVMLSLHRLIIRLLRW